MLVADKCLCVTAHCVPQNLVFFLVILVFNLLTDICIMLVPIPVFLTFPMTSITSLLETPRTS